MLDAIFRIDEVRFDDEKEVWVIKLTMCSENENELRDEFDYYRQQMGEHIDLVSLGDLMYRMGEYDMYIFMNDLTISIVLGVNPQLFFNRDLEEDPNSSASYTGLGNVAGERGEMDVALEYHSKALEMDLNRLSPHHPDIATNYMNLGIVYGDKGLYDKALEYYEKALKINLETDGEEHADVAHVYHNMGGAYAEKKEYEMALQYYEKCLCIREKVLPKHHPDTASTHNNMGITYNHRNDHQSALASKGKAHAIWRVFMYCVIVWR
ncbi:unnamed protein product [Didymodactylos carnosus]|uniref:Kinesin light chain n=1 Tax=Didymodactylos carnosus TaxID=1234261 RepID=A0A8S2HAF1_9BILA|nr:unnamed protein product [Didymodactylos carnosus]CAF3615784.1 unnamed protein product [Didymodactylos carnosus]